MCGGNVTIFAKFLHFTSDERIPITDAPTISHFPHSAKNSLVAVAAKSTVTIEDANEKYLHNNDAIFQLRELRRYQPS
jgi:hypothetical protein